MPVDLPKTSAQQVGGKDEPLVVSVNSKDEVFLGETKYELAELSAKLKAVHEEKPDQRVFIRGDKAINYGKMMEVMGVVIDSGFRQLGLLGEQAQAPAGRWWHGRACACAGAGPRQQQPAPRRAARKTEASDRWPAASSPPQRRDAHAGRRVGDGACRRCWVAAVVNLDFFKRAAAMEPEPVMVDFEAIDKKAAAPKVGVRRRSPRTCRSPRKPPRRRRRRRPSRRRRRRAAQASMSPRPSRCRRRRWRSPSPSRPSRRKTLIALKPKEPEPPKVEKQPEPPKPAPKEVKKPEPPSRRRPSLAPPKPNGPIR